MRDRSSVVNSGNSAAQQCYVCMCVGRSVGTVWRSVGTVRAGMLCSALGCSRMLCKQSNTRENGLLKPARGNEERGGINRGRRTGWTGSWWRGDAMRCDAMRMVEGGRGEGEGVVCRTCKWYCIILLQASGPRAVLAGRKWIAMRD